MVDFKAPELRFAVDIIRQSAQIARRVKSENTFRTISKQDNSPVTIADMAIQAVTGASLKQYFPDVKLVAEEDASVLRAAGEDNLLHVTGYVRSFCPDATPEKVCEWIDRGKGSAGRTFWMLDPIDGTKGYLRGGQYATAIALITEKKIKLSALGCPELELSGHRELGKGIMLLALRGQGCYAASLSSDGPWVRIHVSTCQDLGTSRLLDSYDPNHKSIEKSAFIKNKLGIMTDPIQLDSQAKHAVLAAGEADIFFRTLPKRNPNYREKIWDVAPGAFVIEEAGGRVTDLVGNPIDYGTGNILEKNPGFLATNGLLHDKVLLAIKEAMAQNGST